MNTNQLNILMMILGLDQSRSMVEYVAFICKDIKDIDTFLEYVRTQKDKIEYKKPSEKLEILAREFNEKMFLMSHASSFDAQKVFAKKLADKFREVRAIVKNMLGEGKTANLRDFGVYNDKGAIESLFDDKEINALHAIGSIFRLINLSEIHELEDEIYNLSRGRFIATKKLEIAHSGTNKKVLALLGVA